MSVHVQACCTLVCAPVCLCEDVTVLHFCARPRSWRVPCPVCAYLSPGLMCVWVWIRVCESGLQLCVCVSEWGWSVCGMCAHVCLSGRVLVCMGVHLCVCLCGCTSQWV